jgi:hypothetical protein
MKLPSLVIACAVAVGGSAAVAQTDHSSGSSASGSQGPSLVDKAKAEMHKLGDATRKIAHKVAGKDKKSGDPTDTSTMGGSGSSIGPGSGSGSGSGSSGAAADAGSSGSGGTHGKKQPQH